MKMIRRGVARQTAQNISEGCPTNVAFALVLFCCATVALRIKISRLINLDFLVCHDCEDSIARATCVPQPIRSIGANFTRAQLIRATVKTEIDSQK